MTSSLTPHWIDAVAGGELPDWTEAKPKRRAHMERVAELLGLWAAALELDARDQTRWRAAGWLHDTLRDADAAQLRSEVDASFAHLPDPYMHGPAAARRLRAAGLHDDELLEAIAYHTSGRAGLSRLGRALIAADYLEPGRPDRPLWRATLRARMPGAFDEVFRAVIRDKLARGLERGEPLRSEMVELWNELTDHARQA